MKKNKSVEFSDEELTEIRKALTKCSAAELSKFHKDLNKIRNKLANCPDNELSELSTLSDEELFIIMKEASNFPNEIAKIRKRLRELSLESVAELSDEDLAKLLDQAEDDLRKELSGFTREEKAEKLYKALSEIPENVFAKLSDEDRSMFKDVMSKLSDIYNKKATDPSETSSNPNDESIFRPGTDKTL